MFQSFHLVWYDDGTDQVSGQCSQDAVTELKKVINETHRFTNMKECIDYITGVQKDKVLTICSSDSAQSIVSSLQDISGVISIYILRGKTLDDEEWINQQCKVKGIYEDMASLCEALKNFTRKYYDNSMSISVLNTNDTVRYIKSLNELDSTFMYTQILKEIILTIVFEEKDLKEYISYYSEKHKGSGGVPKDIIKFEREYDKNSAIFWYAKAGFLYSEVNVALRMMKTDAIIKLAFFIRDLHEHISRLHRKNSTENRNLKSFTLYRGQALHRQKFDHVQNSVGGLLSFNCFLSTSSDMNIALGFAKASKVNSDTIEVVFKITVDPTIESTPYAEIKDISTFMEDEILFSMHSVFRIQSCELMEAMDDVWKVDLVLTSDNDPELQAITESIREEVNDVPGWHRIASLFLILGKFKEVHEICDRLWQKTNDIGEMTNLLQCHGIAELNEGHPNDSIELLQYAILLGQIGLPVTQHILDSVHANIGLAYFAKQEYLKAISFYEKALESKIKSLPKSRRFVGILYTNLVSAYSAMRQHERAASFLKKADENLSGILPEKHYHSAAYQANVGSMFFNEGKCYQALSLYQKAISDAEKSLPENHYDFIRYCNNSAVLYNSVGQYSEAISYAEKALDIAKTTLPVYNVETARSYTTRGRAYSSMGQHLSALDYHEKALECYKKSNYNQLDLSVCFNDIGLTYKELRQFSKASSFFQSALKIQQSCLLENQSYLAATYNNIGLMHYDMRNYSRAIYFYEKAIKIQQKSHSKCKLSLAINYNNIGCSYREKGDYTEALSYFEETLKIQEDSLKADHPDLVTSYSNIALLYSKMGDNSKAISLCEKATDILKNSLPPNYFHIATVYYNFSSMYLEMKNYPKAMSFSEDALNNLQASGDVNQYLYAEIQNNLGRIYFEHGDYEKALSCHEKACEFQQRCLSENHPDLAATYSNLAAVCRIRNEVSEAISFYEKALSILKQSLPSNDLHLAVIYTNIGSTYLNIGNFSTALSFVEDGLNIAQCDSNKNDAQMMALQKHLMELKEKITMEPK